MGVLGSLLERESYLLLAHAVVAFLVTLAAVLSADCLAVGALVLGNTFVVFADLVFLATDLAADSLSRVGIALWWLGNALVVFTLLVGLAAYVSTFLIIRASLPFLYGWKSISVFPTV